MEVKSKEWPKKYPKKYILETNSVEFSRVQWLYVGGTATSALSHYGMMKIKNYWPPHPLSTQPVCPPLHPAIVSSLRNKGGGVHTRRAVRGRGGQYIGRRQTLDWSLTV
jgi:hypothetical protein